MRTKTRKKLLALVLALVMVLGLLPVGAAADGGDSGTVPPSSTFTVTYATEGYDGDEVYWITPFDGFEAAIDDGEAVNPGESLSYAPVMEADPWTGYHVAVCI